MTTPTHLTTEQLQSAWRALSRPDWPDLHSLTINSARLKLVEGYALRHLRGGTVAAAAPLESLAAVLTAHPARRTDHPLITTPPRTYDRKRAAAGDFDDKD